MALDEAITAASGLAARSDFNGLLGLLHALCRSGSREEVMRIAAQGVRALVHADGATFVLREGDRCHYAEEDAVSPLWKGRRFPLSACISGWCIVHDERAVIPDIFCDPRIPIDAYRPTFVRSLAMVPVGSGRPMAALGAYWAEQRQPQPDELHMLQAVADATALALSRLDDGRGPGRAGPTPRNAAASQLQPARRGRHRVWAAPDNGLRGYGFAALCVGGAALFRFGLAAAVGPGLLPFAAYFPAILLALLLGGLGPAVFAAALAALAGYWTLIPSGRDAPQSLLLADLALYGACAGLMIEIVRRYTGAVQTLANEDAAHLTMAREQGHRLTNAAAVAEAIVRRSLHETPDKAETLGRRIRASLAGLDPKQEGPPRLLGALILEQLQPFEADRFAVHGDTDSLIGGQQQSLISLAIHELAANAVKHGALSAGGRIDIECRAGDGVLNLAWRESGGPPVVQPTKRGYGSVLLRRLIEAQHGDMTMEFRASGLVSEFRLPLSEQPPL